MRTWECSCSNQLFIDNSQCLSCHVEVGWCPSCMSMVSLISLTEGIYQYQCSTPDCGVFLNKCHNNANEQICNRFVMDALDDARQQLCDCCRYNKVIPDLSVEGNREKWALLEQAKRRLFFTLNIVGLPHGTEKDGIAVPLSFSFMADKRPDAGLWRSFFRDGSNKVYTGHDQGHITINIKESDAAERERLRVDMNESHRTLIGHFRHEIGHYYWELLIKGRIESESVAVFGDHNNPAYGEALEAYYENGPSADWQNSYISAYATMHPWEDFAETFAFYLDAVSVLDTAAHFGMQRASHDGTVKGMLDALQKTGLVMNEINREMGLLDLVPENISPPVVEKIEFIHNLVLNSEK